MMGDAPSINYNSIKDVVKKNNNIPIVLLGAYLKKKLFKWDDTI